MSDKFTLADLMQRSLRDVVLANACEALRNGYFDSTEEFLITAICNLVDSRREMSDNMLRLVREQPCVLTVPKEGA